MIELSHIMTYQFSMKEPLVPTTEGSPNGERQYWEMSKGRLWGADIEATIALPGGDWNSVGNDGFARPDVRVQFVTDDQALILLHYDGLVERNEKFMYAAETNQPTGYEDHYMRMVMHFDTGSKKYTWLNQHLFIAEGRLVGTLEIEYKIYMVS